MHHPADQKKNAQPGASSTEAQAACSGTQRSQTDSHSEDELDSGEPGSPIPRNIGNLLPFATARQRLGGISRTGYYAKLDPKSKQYDKDLPRPEPFFEGGRAVFVLEADLNAYIAKRVEKLRSRRAESPSSRDKSRTRDAGTDN